MLFSFKVVIGKSLSITCVKGSQIDFSYKLLLQSFNITFIIGNSADPDEMQH